MKCKTEKEIYLREKQEAERQSDLKAEFIENGLEAMTKSDLVELLMKWVDWNKLIDIIGEVD